MNVKLFFETHGRFPTQQEFHIIKDFMRLAHSGPDLRRPASTQDLFIDAAKEGNLDEVRRLLPLIRHIDYAPPYPFQQERSRGTALCLAAQGDHLPVVAFLLDNHASVDVRSSQNRTALLFAAESGHFNTINYLISRGATYFTYADQQIESYFISYTIRQSITRRELSHVLPGEVIPGIVLDYLGLGGTRTRPIERLAPVQTHLKNSFGSRPIPSFIVSPIPAPQPLADLPSAIPIIARRPTDAYQNNTNNQGNNNNNHSDDYNNNTNNDVFYTQQGQQYYAHNAYSLPMADGTTNPNNTANPNTNTSYGGIPVPQQRSAQIQHRSADVQIYDEGLNLKRELLYRQQMQQQAIIQQQQQQQQPNNTTNMPPAGQTSNNNTPATAGVATTPGFNPTNNDQSGADANQLH